MIVVLFFTLMLMSNSAVGQDQAVDIDIENAKTPSTLADLLPQGGIDAVGIDYWMIVKTTNAGQPWGDDQYLHWSIRPVQGRLVFEIEQGRGEGQGYYEKKRKLVCTADGKIESYEELYLFGQTTRREAKGQVVGDELVITTTQDNLGHTANPPPDTRKVALEVFEASLPRDWMPLALAYHVRQGSLGYRFATTDLSRNDEYTETQIEDVGTELVEYDGQEVEAHFLLGTKTFPNDQDKQDVTLRMLVLENGDMMQMQITQGDIQFHGQRVTIQEIAKKFGIDPEADEGADEAAQEEAQDAPQP